MRIVAVASVSARWMCRASLYRCSYRVRICSALAYVRLLADDQAERPEVGEAPELGEPDAEVLAPGRGRRALEQLRDRRGGRPPVLGVQARGIQAGVAHHRGRVEAEGSGELDEVVQARVAGQWGRRHASTVPR